MTETSTILFICNSAAELKASENVLRENGYRLQYAKSCEEGLQKIYNFKYKAAILDCRHPNILIEKAIQKIREHYPELILIVIANENSIETAVHYIGLGVTDYIARPFAPRDLLKSLKKAFAANMRNREEFDLKKKLPEIKGNDEIIGNSIEIQKIFSLVKKVAPTDSTILITGESGTGKELLARIIHNHSFRVQNPFIPMDCSALSESLLESELFGHVKGSFTGAIETKPGLIELAHGGTLFLDEIGNMDLYVQGKLLRVIQEREFTAVGGMKKKKIDMRIITATNRNLEKLIEDGKFRKDLFYRLDIVPIHLPPLRERKSDIPLLIYHFIDKFNEKTGKKISYISPEAMNLFVEYDWPGNVRELENIIERLIVTNDGHSINFNHLPIHVSQDMNKNISIPRTNEELKKVKKQAKEQLFSEIERKFILESLRKNNWNVTKAARAVRMQRTNFQAMMKKNEIELKKYI